MNATVPPEVIVDILSKLPVKSLCRFRAVSKSFQALIAYHRFIRMHLKTQRKKLFFFNPPSFYVADLKETSFGQDLQAVELHPCCDGALNQYQVKIGCCDGLVCLTQSNLEAISVVENIFVYNPYTRESKRLPDFQLPFLFNYLTLCGFGYAPTTDDYKFVRVLWRRKLVHVFSLENNSWKTVCDPKLSSIDMVYYLLGTYLNGAIHWVVILNDGSRTIAAFDLVEEKFKYLTLPPSQRSYSERERKNIILVEAFGDCLGIVGVELGVENKIHNEVWIMKEYGVKESWTKISIERRFNSCLVALYFPEDCDGILLSLDDEELVLCDLKDGRCKDIRTTIRAGGKPLVHQGFVSVNVESLVSPNYNYGDFTTKETLGF